MLPVANAKVTVNERVYILRALLYFVKCLFALRRYSHDLRCHARCFIGVEEFHPRDWMVYFADNCVALFCQIIGAARGSSHLKTSPGNFLSH
jgi:hypothetical protein